MYQGKSWIIGNALPASSRSTRLSRMRQSVPTFTRRCKQLPASVTLTLAARLEVDERRAHFRLRAIVERDRGRLQHMLAAARWVLRMRASAFQALDTQLEQQQVFVGQRVVRRALGLRRALQRHPVAAVVGEQREPFVVAPFVEQARLVGHEVGW